MYNVEDLKNHKDLLPLVAKTSDDIPMMYNEVNALERVHEYACEHSKFEDILISIPMWFAKGVIN